ncbi:MAG TPA: SRPBCC family protein [Roseovarius sp.]
MKLAMTTAFVAFAALQATGAWSADYKVQRTLQLSSSATDVWNMAGDFCDIDDWHPAIADCALKAKDGALYRILTTVDGAEFVEKRIAVEAGQSYTYTIESSPLSIEKYTATFSIESLNGSLISWSGSFSSDDPSMEAAIAGIYESGLSAIENVFADR